MVVIFFLNNKNVTYTNGRAFMQMYRVIP